MGRLFPLRPGVGAGAVFYCHEDKASYIDNGVRPACFDITKMTHRPSLTVRWRDHGLRLVVVGMNPSAATAELLDPTVRNIVYYAQRLRMAGKPFGSLSMLNLYDRRQTSGFKAEDGAVQVAHERGGEQVRTAESVPARSPLWRDVVELQIKCADLVILACGGPAQWEDLDDISSMCLRLTGELPRAWRTNDDGKPAHPRGMSSDILPSRWSTFTDRNGYRHTELAVDIRFSLFSSPPKPSKKRMDFIKDWLHRGHELNELEQLLLWRWG